MQRVERAGRRLRQRSVESLDERASDSPSFSRSFDVVDAEQRQHLLFGGNLDLLACQYFAAFRVDRFEREDVVASKAGDGARDQRFQLLAPGDLARNLAREALVGRALHEAQGFSHAIVRDTP